MGIYEDNTGLFKLLTALNEKIFHNGKTDIQQEMSKVNVPGIIMESLYDLRSLYAKRFANKDESEDENEIGCPYISDRRMEEYSEDM